MKLGSKDGRGLSTSGRNMLFYQRRFFAYPSGAPSLNTLSSVSSHSHTLVTTDRCVSLLSYGDAGYSLHKLDVDDLRNDNANVVASAIMERPGTLQSQLVVAYTVEEMQYLQVLSPRYESLEHTEAADTSDCEKFELQAAPTCMFNMQVLGSNGDTFSGVVVCCTDSMVAIGYIVNKKENSSTGIDAVCTRLDNQQFAVFFPEFATFTHTILAVDIITSPTNDHGWIAFGCADGLVRVFNGHNDGGCLSGPFKIKNLLLNGPVTSVALYLTHTTTTKEAKLAWHCNLLVTCAIGQALVYEDLFGAFDHIGNGEVLMDSDTFDSIFVGIVADIDLDGHVELLLGTDNQVMLAYKEISDRGDSRRENMNETATKHSLDSNIDDFTAASPLSPGSSYNIWDDLETIPLVNASVPITPESSLTRWKWQRLSRNHWDLETFGAIYSLLWRDINHDGAFELLVASSTGIYVYEVDPIFVIQKLVTVLQRTPGRPESVFAATSASSTSYAKPGLFQLPDLHTPLDFSRLTQDVKLQCHQLRQELAAASPGLQTLRILDDISNVICSVIDAAELCRNVHPNEDFRRAASESFTDLSNFIQNLNADVDLYRSLNTVTKDHISMKIFTPEQKRMGILLRNEFERDGIHLPHADRQRVVSLQNEITQLSMQFQSTMHSAREYVEIPATLMRGMPHSITSVCERKWMSRDTLRVPTDMHVMNTVLKWVGDSETRRKMYVAANSCAKANLPVLDKLRAKRHELAQLLGFPTFAHLATSDRMIGSPEAVEKFIGDIARQLMAKAKMEQQLLLDAKRKNEGRSVTNVYMWDLPYYMGMLKAQKHQIDSRVISAYFPLDNCLKGLHLLCSALFGLDLKQVPMLNASECWHDDVVKLALIRSGETLGYMYFDLYPRPNKYSHAAHFTIRCGKRLSDTSYQKPIVALVCNFNKPAPDSPSLLTHAEVETLFHEFGHVMHSLLSRTEFQHLSGTRATLDFVETPSHLFEYFAWDYRVVSEFAHHYRTGAPFPPAMMQGLRDSKTMFAAMDTQTQCLYSMLDLQLFKEQPLPCSPNTTTQMMHELQNSSTLVPHVDGTYWHTRFGHLIGYGAGYYSYLYARVFAADIWHTNFAGPQGPLNCKAGERLYKKLMIHGGAKDPNELLVDMLGREPSPTSYLHELGV
ncbi:hypothetical protein DD238_001718 [Peronospora effusa]|uniref:Peptidase M3A/M3B catalytic domain-containing protein n=1 Tax=Peronospora effusa TaxID=542832 RepID=A0A3M6VTR9_9STRA|nr:hypothetical protein DD238_001718 [Peronospora effusa]